MSSSRSRTSNPVSLFPFLAVLMCTMGALILLLIVTSRRIRREAVARSVRSDRLQPVSRIKPQPAEAGHSERTKPAEAGHYEPVVPQLPDLRPIVKAPGDTDRIVAEHRAAIVRTNAKRKAELARLQSELADVAAKRDAFAGQLAAALKRHDASRAELKRLQAARTTFAQSAAAGAEQLAKSQADIRTQAVEINGIRRKLALLKLQQARASSRYAVVPFDGSTGTTRRPIYIECTDKAIRFLPEDVEITAADLLGFTPDDNPLLAATQRLLHYWTVQARAGGNPNEPEPYVLLLVRPSGSVAYYAARKMLRNLNHAVGYELIEADWDLHLPPVDTQAKAVCELAVNRALGHRRRVIASVVPDPVVRPPGAAEGRVMKFNRSTGRFEVTRDESKPPLGPFGGVVDGDPGRMRRRAPIQDGDGKRRTDWQSVPRPGERPSAPSGSSLGGGGDRRMDWQSDPRSTNGQFGPKTDGTTNPAGTAKLQSPSTNAGSNPGNNGQPDLWPLAGNNPAGLPDGAADAGANGNSSAGIKSPHTSVSGPAGEVGSAKRPTSKPSYGTPAGSSGQRQSRVNGGAATLGSGLFGDSGGRSNQFAPPRRWGFSSPNASIGFEREIEIAVTTDRLIVRDKQTIRVGNGESQDELVKRLAAAVEREVRSWGKPPDSFYWVPTLRFAISPGGNRHYERLSGPVRKLGLQSAAEYRLETPPDATKTR